jgi:hypothetical protein
MKTHLEFLADKLEKQWPCYQDRCGSKEGCFCATAGRALKHTIEALNEIARAEVDWSRGPADNVQRLTDFAAASLMFEEGAKYWRQDREEEE